MHLDKTWHFLIGLLVVTFLVLALTYDVIILPLEGLDEIEHFGVVRYVVDTGCLPIILSAVALMALV